MTTANVIHRVYRIKYKDRVGTCFTIDKGSQRYLITAKHIVKNMKDSDIIQIEFNNEWINREANLIGHGDGSIDISVLTSDLSFSVDHPLPPSDAGLILSQNVFFIGFPTVVVGSQKTSPQFLELNRNFPLPIVRQGIVSWMHNDFILIDAHGNIGFSGAPVVFKPTGSDLYSVAAVIAKRADEIKPVYKTPLQADNDGGNGIKPIGYYRDNSGIITAYSIKHALNLIN
jgi:S1-C subfamily serine protease